MSELSTTQATAEFPQAGRELAALLRQQFPYARGRELSVQQLWKIVATSIAQSNIRQEGRDTSWLRDPGIRDSLLLRAYLQGNEERKNGGELALTHDLRTAQEMWEDKDCRARGINPLYLAFGQAPGVAARFVAHHCWRGEPALIPTIVQYIKDHTDVPGLQKSARIEEQIRRLSGDSMSWEARRGRIYDKLEHVEHDMRQREAGNMSDNAVQHYAMLAHSKRAVLDVIKGRDELPRALEERYDLAQQYLWNEAKAVAERQTQAQNPEEQPQPGGIRVTRRRLFRTVAEAASLGGVTVLRALKPT
jgi:hypothetical protein